MRLVALVYLLGAIAALLLPVNVTGAAIAAVALGLWRVRLALVLSMGYLLTANSVEHYIELRQAFDGGTARLVVGPIVEFPRRNSNGWRASMALVQDAPRASLSGTYFRIELSGTIAHSPPELGQWCVYYVRSRRPHAFAVRVGVRPDGYKVHSARSQRANFWSSAWPAARNSEAPIGD